MKIEINNRQELYRPSISRIRLLVRHLMKLAGKLEPCAKWSEISVVLLDNSGIKALNKQLLDKNGFTDVLSLRYDPVPGDTGCLTGEIFVNVQRAFQCARKTRDGWDASREFALYLAHGCDHLMNSTDYDNAGYNRMRRRELGWLKKHTIAALSSNLLKQPACGRTQEE